MPKFYMILARNRIFYDIVILLLRSPECNNDDVCYSFTNV